MTTRRLPLRVLLCSSVACLFLPGCSAGPRNFENDNDRLRKENADLTEQVAALSTQVESLEKLAKATERPATEPLPQGLIAPRCAAVVISQFSGGIDTDKDQIDDAVRLYLRTVDLRDRFVQVVGRLKISLVQIIPGKEVLTLATAEFDPKQFDDTYRSGITGAHYTLQIPLPQTPPGLKQITCRICLTDLQTGAEHQDEALLPWSGR